MEDNPMEVDRLEVNRPDVIDEVAAAFEDYEEALKANDVAAMNTWFWDSDLTVRYGIAECLYGSEEIARWRQGASPVPDGRRLANTVVVTFGSDHATVSTEFRYPRSRSIGRQTQTWTRFPSGWKIVAAHVSTIDS